MQTNKEINQGFITKKFVIANQKNIFRLIPNERSMLKEFSRDKN